MEAGVSHIDPERRFPRSILRRPEAALSPVRCHLCQRWWKREELVWSRLPQTTQLDCLNLLPSKDDELQDLKKLNIVAKAGVGHLSL